MTPSRKTRRPSRATARKKITKKKTAVPRKKTAAPRKKTAAPRKKTAKKKVATTRTKTAKKKPARRKPEPARPEEERAGKPRRPRTVMNADQLARRQRDSSVAEFFSKNRHLLGFDNPKKALLTTVKEAVDNALDACEEAGRLPDLRVEIHSTRKDDRLRVAIEDNGPGIVSAQVPKIFGKLLYGSKFHSLKQSRGQQGIGISAAAMYGQLTTGEPITVTSRPGARRPARRFRLQIDTQRNRPHVISNHEVPWEHTGPGTRVEIELQARFQKGRQSVDEYLEQTAIANPHARIVSVDPDGVERVHERSTDELPDEPREIKPHPYGVELGVLDEMLRATRARYASSFLAQDFSRVSPRVAEEICREAGVDPRSTPTKIAHGHVEALYEALQRVKVMTPPTDCITPIGEERILEGLRKELDADFVVAVSRRPSVYRGNPFAVEVGLAYGGREASADDPIRLVRLANRVPLQYQQGACAITKAVVQTDWKKYNLHQSRGALPLGPMVLMIHIASVWVPFTSESKEAIAHYPEILKEVKLAVQECGRKLGTFVNKRRREVDAARKRAYIQKYIPHVGIALREILELSDRQEKKIVDTLTDVLERSRK